MNASMDMPSTVSSSAFGEGEPESEAQRDRHKRIIGATISLASKGGYDAVQMRAVAERANVALGTLYRYFPSKIHLLVASLASELERANDKTGRSRTISGDTPRDRVLYVLGRTTRALQRDPNLTEAITRAFMFADASVAAEVDTVGHLMEHMFTRAMTSGGQPTEEQKAIARVIGDVWLSNLVAWVTRRASATDVASRLELAVRMLLR